MATNNQRRDAARRKLEAELAQRQVEQSHRRSRMLTFSITGSVIAVILVVILVSVLVSGGGTKKTASASPSPTTASDTSTPSTTSTPEATKAAPGDCTFANNGTPSKPVKAPPATGNPTTGTANVTFTTNQGTFVLQLDRAGAPCTVASFLSLTSQKYFDATKCHRLTTSGIYVLQCGDPTANGTAGSGGSGGPGYGVPDEMTGHETYPAGTLAMANTGAPNSGGSQFFIVTQDSSSGLGTGKYTVFGKVISGMDVITKIAKAGTADGSGDGLPKLPVDIETATIS